MLPRVILHSGISLDGRIDWGAPEDGLYYELVMTVFADVDAMLSGSNTILAAYEGRELPPEGPEAFEPRRLDPDDRRQLLVVVDSRGRVRGWHAIRNEPYWRDVVVLVSQATPSQYLDYLAERHIDYIQTDGEQVNLRAALEALHARYGIERVRVDSGGVLNGVLLRDGLIDEVSVVINPGLVGGTSPRTMYVAPDLTSGEGVVRLRLTHVERMRADVVWLRYDVVK